LTFELSLPDGRYTDEKRAQAMPQLLDAIRSTPGVTSAGAISYIPLANFGFNGPFTIVGRPPLAIGDRVEFRAVTPGYFGSMGIPFGGGGNSTGNADQLGRRIALINERMAKRYWPDGDPIGSRVHFVGEPVTNAREIVGVVGDVRSRSLDSAAVP